MAINLDFFIYKLLCETEKRLVITSQYIHTCEKTCSLVITSPIDRSLNNDRVRVNVSEEDRCVREGWPREARQFALLDSFPRDYRGSHSLPNN